MIHPEQGPSPDICPLPIVTPETLAELTIDIACGTEYVDESMDLMRRENSDLGGDITNLIELAAGDDRFLARHMAFTAVMVYRGLRAQAESEQPTGEFDTE